MGVITGCEWGGWRIGREWDGTSTNGLGDTLVHVFQSLRPLHRCEGLRAVWWQCVAARKSGRQGT